MTEADASLNSPTPARVATHAGSISSSLYLQAAVPPKSVLPSPPKLLAANITSRWGTRFSSENPHNRSPSPLQPPGVNVPPGRNSSMVHVSL